MTSTTITVRFMDDRDADGAAEAIIAHLFETFNDDGSIEAAFNTNVWQVVAQAVSNGEDSEADFYDGQSPVEDWALAALDSMRTGDYVTAKRLIDTWEDLEWSAEGAYGDPEEGQRFRQDFNWTEDYYNIAEVKPA